MGCSTRDCVQMGDGAHCRPAVDALPVGTRRILALNGPGPKPGDGWSLSRCGDFSAQVTDGDADGCPRIGALEFSVDVEGGY